MKKVWTIHELNYVQAFGTIFNSNFFRNLIFDKFSDQKNKFGDSTTESVEI